MVTIGKELNQICKIENITETEIKCRTPEKNEYYTVGQAQTVTVLSKLIVATQCAVSDPCWFTYNPDTDSPLLESISSDTV